MRFPLNKQKVIGYDYGVKTSYSDKHLGVDWEAEYVPLYAPKAGKIMAVVNGIQGGNTIWFQPTGEQIIIRWMHLSKFLVKLGDMVKEGQQIAITGNTGEETTAAHLHEDIWKHAVTLKFEDTINPHDYYKMQATFIHINGTPEFGLMYTTDFVSTIVRFTSEPDAKEKLKNVDGGLNPDGSINFAKAKGITL